MTYNRFAHKTCTRLLPVLLALGGWITAQTKAAPLPDSLTVSSVDVTGDGLNDTILLHKRSIRAANFRLWTWTTNGGYVRVTNVPPVTTYRGYVQTDPSLRVNGFVNYLDKMSLNVTEGRNNSVARPENVDLDLDGPAGAADPGTGNVEIPLATNRLSPTSQGFLIPTTTMRKLRVGIDTTARYCANARYQGTNGTIDIARALAAAEQRLNDTDMFYARDMGLAWEITDFILRLDGDPSNWKTFWKGNDGILPLPFNTKVRLDGDTGGGSGGRVFSATADFPNSHSVTAGGPNKWESASIGHEVGHGLAVGHYSSYKDTMSGAESALGAGTVQRMIEQLHLASAHSAPAITYGDELAPYAMEDFANTPPGQPVDINLLANDYDGNGDALTLSYVETLSDAGGTVTNLGGGLVRYTPPAAHLGVDRFRYHVADTDGIENRTGVVKIYTRSSGLANHWLFDQTTGTTVWDIGPYQAHGIVESGLTTLADGTRPGKLGHAYENLVSGSKSTVTADAGDPLDLDLSVSLWVKFHSLPDLNSTLLCKGGAVIRGRINKIRGGWAISVVGDRFYFACKTQPDLELTQLAADLQAPSPIVSNQWYHLAMVMDRTNHQLRAWINGAQVTSSPSGNTFIPDGFIENWYPLRMLNCSFDDASTAAVLDDVRIYNQALSGAEIAALYAANDDPPAGAPSPANGATAVSNLENLSWVPGRPDTYQYDVYFGANQTDVLNATLLSQQYAGRFATNHYAPLLALSATYYWRVDQVTSNSLPIPSPVWQFTTDSTTTFSFDNGGGDELWSNPLNWSPDGAPVPGTNYFVNAGYTIKSPGAVEEGTPKTYTFAGQSLTVRDGATLDLAKLNSGGVDAVTINIPNLTVENSSIKVRAGRNYELSLGRGLHFEGVNHITLADSAYGVNLFLKGGLTGSGSIFLQRDNKGYGRWVHLQSGSFAGYSGDWIVSGISSQRFLELAIHQPSGWGSGNLLLGSYSRLVLNASLDAPNSSISINASSASINVASAQSLRVGSLGGAGGTITLNTTASLQTGVSDATDHFGGVITGAGRLIKDGWGALTLSGANDYTGPTWVSGGGVLLVNGSLASSAVTVQSGNTLGGSGTIAGVVTVQDEGILSPGSSIGELTLNSPPILQGAVLMELDRTASPNADRLVLTHGSLTYGGTLIVTNVSGALLPEDTFDLFDATGLNGAFAALELPPLEPGLAWDVSLLQTAGLIRVGLSANAPPPDLVWATSANTLHLSWSNSLPPLVLQSNRVGLASPDSWADIPGSDSITNLDIMVTPNTPKLFYRLRQ